MPALTDLEHSLRLLTDTLRPLKDAARRRVATPFRNDASELAAPRRDGARKP
jgi:hypothetical protein